MTLGIRVGLWLLVGGWVGALVLFAGVVAPTAFGALASGEAGGAVVGPILQALNYYGIAAGLALAVIARNLGRGGALVAIPLALALVCAVSEFAVTGNLRPVLPHQLGPESDPGDAGRFAFLHQLSQLLFAGVLLGAVTLLVLHAREDVRERIKSGR